MCESRSCGRARNDSAYRVPWSCARPQWKRVARKSDLTSTRGFFRRGDRQAVRSLPGSVARRARVQMRDTDDFLQRMPEGTMPDRARISGQPYLSGRLESQPVTREGERGRAKYVPCRGLLADVHACLFVLTDTRVRNGPLSVETCVEWLNADSRSIPPFPMQAWLWPPPQLCSFYVNFRRPLRAPPSRRSAAFYIDGYPWPSNFRSLPLPGANCDWRPFRNHLFVYIAIR